MGPESSTNFLKAAITAGRVKRSQKISISRRRSSWGMGLMNFFAAARVVASNLVICAAVPRASRRDFAFGGELSDKAYGLARVALTLRPVRSRSRTEAVA